MRSPIWPSSPTIFSKPHRSGDTAVAVDYARRAGDQAAQSLAYEEAARLYGMALGALELHEPTDQETCRASCYWLSASPRRALEISWERGRRSCGRNQSPAEAPPPANLPGQHWVTAGRFLWARAGDDPHLVPMLQDALAHAWRGGRAAPRSPAGAPSVRVAQLRRARALRYPQPSGARDRSGAWRSGNAWRTRWRRGALPSAGRRTRSNGSTSQPSSSEWPRPQMTSSAWPRDRWRSACSWPSWVRSRLARRAGTAGKKSQRTATTLSHVAGADERDDVRFAGRDFRPCRKTDRFGGEARPTAHPGSRRRIGQPDAPVPARPGARWLGRVGSGHPGRCS